MAPARKPKRSENIVEHKDSLREIVETIVFVVVLVLLLKSFAAEAFVIPTGSMAETLYGYQKLVTCPKCKIEFPLNASSEADPPQKENRVSVTSCICPNCFFAIDFEREGDPGWRTGDRVLVAKFLYDTVMSPERFDVIVFKFPKEPQKNHGQLNYIKRLTGLPGETVGIHGGDLYVSQDLTYEGRPRPALEEDLRKKDYMYVNDSEAVDLFREQLDQRFEPVKEARGKKFAIVRKEPDKVLAVRRLVYDNDFPASDQSGNPRWLAGDWKTDNSKQPRRFVSPAGAEVSWLRYRHLKRDSALPALITDFMGYNTGKHDSPQQNWVGDLMLECDATIQKPAGELILELSKGVDRFQARFNLAAGVCTLVRVSDGKEETLDSKSVELKKDKTYQIRLANVDQRLIVWVDQALPFDNGVSYRPPIARGPTRNDLEPASIGVKGGEIAVDHIRLWRDTYYTTARNDSPNNADADRGDWSFRSESWSDPDKWEPLRNLPVKTLYVQPGHYLGMGDNSPESSDSRDWGVVPRRLLLGRALLVYYPFYRAGPIR